MGIRSAHVRTVNWEVSLHAYIMIPNDANSLTLMDSHMVICRTPFVGKSAATIAASQPVKLTRQSVLPGSSSAVAPDPELVDTVSDTYRRIQEFGCLCLSTPEHRSSRLALLFDARLQSQSGEEAMAVEALTEDVKEIVLDLLNPDVTRRMTVDDLLVRIARWSQ
jgi:hypothetical protein